MHIRNMLNMIACLGLSLMLVACETTSGGGSDKSSERSRLVAQTDDYRRTIIEGMQIGAVVGGVGAALITAAAGGSSQDVVRNGLIGAAIGGAFGGVAGKDVADKKQSYVAREDSLNAVIDQARVNNEKLSRMVSTAAVLVRQRRAEAAALKGDSADQKRTFSASIAEDQSALSDAISASRREISQLKSLKTRYSGNASLINQIGQAESKQEKLVDARNSLNDIRKSVQ